LYIHKPGRKILVLILAPGAIKAVGMAMAFLNAGNTINTSFAMVDAGMNGRWGNAGDAVVNGLTGHGAQDEFFSLAGELCRDIALGGNRNIFQGIKALEPVGQKIVDTVGMAGKAGLNGAKEKIPEGWNVVLTDFGKKVTDLSHASGLSLAHGNLQTAMEATAFMGDVAYTGGALMEGDILGAISGAAFSANSFKILRDRAPGIADAMSDFTGNTYQRASAAWKKTTIDPQVVSNQEAAFGRLKDSATNGLGSILSPFYYFGHKSDFINGVLDRARTGIA
jgi:hypothetical protein